VNERRRSLAVKRRLSVEKKTLTKEVKTEMGKAGWGGMKVGDEEDGGEEG